MEMRIASGATEPRPSGAERAVVENVVIESGFASLEIGKTLPCRMLFT